MIAIVGPGAIGGVLAASLVKAGRPVVLCARRPVVLEVGGAPVRVPVWTDPEQASPVEHVIVTTKAYDSAGTAPWFARLGDAPVAIVQNGVEHRERFADFVAAARLLEVVIDLSAQRDGDRIEQRHRGKLTVVDDARGRAFAALFAGADLAVELATDMRSVAWRKLCTNVVGAVPTLTLRPTCETPEAVARELVRECIAVGRAEGADLPDAIADEVIARVKHTPATAFNSMHADRLAGRRLEVDARNGAVVRLGTAHAIRTPYNHVMLELLLAIDRSISRVRNQASPDGA